MIHSMLNNMYLYDIVRHGRAQRKNSSTSTRRRAKNRFMYSEGRGTTGWHHGLVAEQLAAQAVAEHYE